MAAGVPMVIANSDEDNVIRRVVGGEELGTLLFPVRKKCMPAKVDSRYRLPGQAFG